MVFKALRERFASNDDEGPPAELLNERFMRPHGWQKPPAAPYQPAVPRYGDDGGDDAPDGVIVTDVVPGGPADRAGFRNGDVITAVDSVPTPDEDALSAALSGGGPGHEPVFTVRRSDGSTARLSGSA